jgi:hypothetical protein
MYSTNCGAVADGRINKYETIDCCRCLVDVWERLDNAASIGTLSYPMPDGRRFTQELYFSYDVERAIDDAKFYGRDDYEYPPEPDDEPKAWGGDVSDVDNGTLYLVNPDSDTDEHFA